MDLRQRLNQLAPPDLQPMEHRHCNIFEVTVKELLTVCDANSSHPGALEFETAVQGLPLDMKVYVEKENLEALLDNKTVEEYMSIETDKKTGTPCKVIRKRLVPFKAESTPAPVEVPPAPVPVYTSRKEAMTTPSKIVGAFPDPSEIEPDSPKFAE